MLVGTLSYLHLTAWPRQGMDTYNVVHQNPLPNNCVQANSHRNHRKPRGHLFSEEKHLRQHSQTCRASKNIGITFLKTKEKCLRQSSQNHRTCQTPAKVRADTRSSNLSPNGSRRFKKHLFGLTLNQKRWNGRHNSSCQAIKRSGEPPRTVWIPAAALSRVLGRPRMCGSGADVHL